MAIALAPRVYGLDAICAAALQTGGGEDVAHFARRVFGRVADKDLAAAAAEQRAAAAVSLLAFMVTLPVAFLSLVPSGAVGSGIFDVVPRKAYLADPKEGVDAASIAWPSAALRNASRDLTAMPNSVS